MHHIEVIVSVKVTCLNQLGTKAMRDANSGPTACMYEVRSSVNAAMCSGFSTRISSKRCEFQQNALALGTFSCRSVIN